MRNWLLLLVAFSIVVCSCSDTIPAGTDVLPGSDLPDNFYNDTTTIYSWTVTEDTLRSDKLFSSPLGYIDDPTFGRTDASLLIGLRIPASSINPSLTDTFGGFYLDSVVLALAIDEAYGDTNLPMGFTLYKLPTPLNTNQIYYSNTNFPQGMVEIGRISNYYPLLSREFDEDSVFTELGPQLRIKLNPFFGQSLINILNTDQMVSNDLFHQYMPGIVIIPDEMPGSMLRINMLTSSATSSRRTALTDSRVHMYYKNEADSILNLIYPATVLNLGINNFNHDYSSTNVETALNSESENGDPVNYIQGLAGVKTKITFPFLSAYSESTAIIKAELIVTELGDGLEDTYSPPQRIFALRVGENGMNENVTDFSTLPAGHFGGYAEEVTLDNGDEVMQYRINISDYFQSLIFGQEVNDGMYLTVYPAQDTDLTTVNASDLIPNRVVIGGGNNTMDDYKLKLEVTYAVLD